MINRSQHVISDPETRLSKIIDPCKGACALIFVGAGSLAKFSSRETERLKKITRIHVNSNAVNVTWESISHFLNIEELSMQRTFSDYQGIDKMLDLKKLYTSKGFSAWGSASSLPNLKEIGATNPTKADLEIILARRNTLSLSLTSIDIEALSKLDPKNQVVSLRINFGKGRKLNTTQLPLLQNISISYCAELKEVYAEGATCLFVEYTKKMNTGTCELPKLKYLRARSCSEAIMEGAPKKLRSINSIFMQSTKNPDSVLGAIKHLDHLNEFVSCGWSISEPIVKKASEKLPGKLISNGAWAYINGVRREFDPLNLPKEILSADKSALL